MTIAVDMGRKATKQTTRHACWSSLSDVPVKKCNKHAFWLRAKFKNIGTLKGLLVS